MPISLAEATLVSIFSESFLYGVFTVLFVISIFILLRRKGNNGELNKPMLLACLALFVFSTVHVSADLRRLLDAFLRGADPATQLGQVDTTTYEIKSAAYVAQTWVGDGLMLYRLYLVWNGDKRVVIPISIFFLAGIGVGIGTLQAIVTTSSTYTIFQLHNWIASFFSITLTINFTCTFLIAARILHKHRDIGGLKVSGRSLMPTVIIIIESGAIYSACLIIMLVLFLSNSYAQYIALDAVTQIIGVVFSLIIVRVGLGISSENRRQFPRSALRGSSIPRTPQNLSHPLRPVVVSISTMSHSDAAVEQCESEVGGQNNSVYKSMEP
ncbi:hypothetical protein BV22DRAFT_1020440 [Leucogyrophana mollusca]|uniref:Uncharacterized protein n=1 Tax=Leucogyrophana mollusca TaxID=85980 RepID=A0ACB8B7K4_9AGAM|nr:hypothetical protein BV22DRAFT_1020440 [Leucogyrophana mollusca]